jgi:hypothetical protein
VHAATSITDRVHCDHGMRRAEYGDIGQPRHGRHQDAREQHDPRRLMGTVTQAALELAEIRHAFRRRISGCHLLSAKSSRHLPLLRLRRLREPSVAARAILATVRALIAVDGT